MTGPVSGLLNSDVPGRTDRLPIVVAPDSYVIPADVVSGYGQGNTAGGAKILDQVFGGHVAAVRKAKGGAVTRSGNVPIVAAGGEYIVPPDVVRSVGGGDARRGHQHLDKMVRERRKAVARHTMRLPPPKND